MKKRRVLIVILVFAILFVGVELFLRYYYGFCDAVLMQEDPHFEYIAQPSQHRFRFRNHVIYNSMSMRSDEVDTSATVILGFGDSIINGGLQTDHDSLATTIMSDSLTKRLGKKVQFLNISAGSWAPDNCYAYLKQKGDFGAACIFLFVSSHDAYDNMTFDKTVGVHESFPTRQYKLATYELIHRYLLPRLRARFPPPSQATPAPQTVNKQESGMVFNPGFESFLNYTAKNKIPFVIYLHAENAEVQAKSYNSQGKQIIEFAKQNNVPLILDLEHDLQLADFRDLIHINPRGQKKLAKTVLRSITDLSMLQRLQNQQ